MAKKIKNTKMEKKQNTKPAVDTTKTAATTKDASKKPAAPKTIAPPKEPEVVEVVEVKVDQNTDPKQVAKNMVGTTKSALDANHRVDLLNLAQKIFVDDPDAVKRYGVNVVESMTQITAAGVVAAMVDEAVYGEGTFKAVLSTKMYPQLIAAASDLGITLPDIKALPGAKDIADAVELDSKDIKPSKEAKQKLAEEHAIMEETPETDPKKVFSMGEEALAKALQYMLVVSPRKDKSIMETLIAVVDFMREYRMEEANHAENASEALLKYDDRTVEDWLNDAFQYAKPTFLINGIARGMTTTIGVEKSPITAFCILRKTLTANDGTIVWDDQSIADAVKCIVRVVVNQNIADNKKSLEELDPKHKDYKEVSEKYKSVITHYEEILDNMCNPNFDIVANLIEKRKEDGVMGKLYNRLIERYYPNSKGINYKNLDFNVQQRAGVICNMFADKGLQNPAYTERNIGELETYTEEELKDLQKRKLEEAKTKKTSEGESDEKNS